MLRVLEDHWVSGAKRIPSPNADERPDASDVRLIVIHAISLPPGRFGTGLVEALFLNRLDANAAPELHDLAGLKVSSHFFITRRGGLVQFVQTHRRAWHAGVSAHGGRVRCNDYSIGIELEGTDEVPFTESQYAKLDALLKALFAYHPLLGVGDVVGHAEIAPGRKTDPGPCFDWRRVLRGCANQHLSGRQA